MTAPPGHAPEDGAESSAPPYPGLIWGLSRSDVRVIAGLGALALLLICGRTVYLATIGRPTIELRDLRPAAETYRIDVNSATWIEWLQLEQIGETLAKRIVEDREQNGPFRSVDDLTRVKGIGVKTLEKLRPYLRCDTPRPRKADLD